MNPFLNLVSIMALGVALVLVTLIDSSFQEHPLLQNLWHLWNHFDLYLPVSSLWNIMIPFASQVTLLMCWDALFSRWISLWQQNNAFEGLTINYLRDSRSTTGLELSAQAVARIAAVKFEVEALLFRLASSLKDYVRPILGSNLSEFRQLSLYPDAKHSSLSPLPPVVSERHSDKFFESFGVYTDSEPFYLPQLATQKINQLTGTPELLTQNRALQLRTAIINSLRWTYKYNTLHRRSIHNAYKLTNVKRLFSLGYFDFKITGSNVWFSDQYGRDLNKGKPHQGSTSADVLSSSLRLLYNPSLSHLKSNQLFTSLTAEVSTDAFQRLAFYESSFYFFLKRSYLFTTLDSHSLSLLPLKGDNRSQGVLNTTNLINLQQALVTMPLQDLKGGHFPKVEERSVVPTLSSGSVTGGSSQMATLLTRFDKNMWTLTNLTRLYNFDKTMELTNQQLPIYLITPTHLIGGTEDPMNLFTKV